MSCYDSTDNKQKVGRIIQTLIDSNDHLNTEVLVYFDEKESEWKITLDRRFFSYGYKLEDKIEHLERLISMCQSGLNHAMTATSLYNARGILKDIKFELNEGMLDYKNNEIEWAK